MPLLKRVTGVFFSPRPVFESLRDHPKWLDVLLIGIVLSLLFYLPMSPFIEKLSIERAREQIESADGLSQERRDQAIEQQENFMRGPVFKAISIGSIVIFTPAMLLIFALLFLLGYGFLLGGQLKFIQAFSAACHLNLIFVLAGLVKLPLVLARQSVEVATSLALVSPDPNSSSVVYAALDMFDLFTIWALLVAIAGMAVMARVSTGKSRVFGVILFVVMLLFRVGTAMLGRLGAH